VTCDDDDSQLGMFMECQSSFFFLQIRTLLNMHSSEDDDDDDVVEQ